MFRKEETKRRIGARTAFAIVILFATLLAAASGVSFAKNLSSSSGGDNAQVSVLIMEVQGTPSDNLNIDCVQEIMTAAYKFAVTNMKDGKTAEVSFKYDVILRLPEALPEGISITVDGANGTTSSDRKTVTIADVGAFYGGKFANARTYSRFFRG